MKPDAPILLIDTPGLIFRAYYSIRPLTSPDGIPTNAVYGVLLQLVRVLTDVKPRACAAFFDTAAPSFRKEEFKDYKAQRPLPPAELVAQIPVVIEALERADCPVFLEPGYEADDLIASFAHTYSDLPKLILTGDKDLLQLLGDQTSVMMQTKGVVEVKVYTPEVFREEYGFEPENFVDFKALRGDPSDNIPGVPGIGEKTARSLISAFKNLEELYMRLGEVKPERIRVALESRKEEVFAYRELVRLRRESPLGGQAEVLRLPNFQRQEFLAFCDKYSLRAIKKQVGFPG
mgnify:CR=1 FL=1